MSAIQPISDLQFGVAKSDAAKPNFVSNLKLIWVVRPASKNIRFTFRKIRTINIAVSRPPEGRIAIVTTRWARDAMDAARHRRMAVARRSLLAKQGLLRTAKSCGPGAAMLALSLWRFFRR
jgi:hypothetical protein